MFIKYLQISSIFFELTNDLINIQHYMNDLMFEFLNDFRQIYLNDILFTTNKKNTNKIDEKFARNLKKRIFKLISTNANFLKSK